MNCLLGLLYFGDEYVRSTTFADVEPLICLVPVDVQQAILLRTLYAANIFNNEDNYKEECYIFHFSRENPQSHNESFIKKHPPTPLFNHTKQSPALNFKLIAYCS
jgi:hypothetical protein